MILTHPNCEPRGGPDEAIPAGTLVLIFGLWITLMGGFFDFLTVLKKVAMFYSNCEKRYQTLIYNSKEIFIHSRRQCQHT